MRTLEGQLKQFDRPHAACRLYSTDRGHIRHIHSRYGQDRENTNNELGTAGLGLGLNLHRQTDTSDQ